MVITLWFSGVVCVGCGSAGLGVDWVFWVLVDLCLRVVSCLPASLFWWLEHCIGFRLCYYFDL